MVPGNFFLGSLVGCFFIDRSVKFQKKMKYLVRCILSAVSCFMSSLNNRERNRSTLVCTILQKSVTFDMINVVKKTFQLKVVIRKMV